jgi:Tetratricopeptide repeat/WD40-like Beta Propeller Repeat
MHKFFLICPLILLATLLPAQSGYNTLKTTKDEARAAFNNGRMHSEQGEPAIAIGYYESALRKDPYLIDARLAIADAHVEIKDYFKAERLFEEALALDTFYAPVAFFFLAKIEWHLEKYGEAAQHCASYLSKNPQNPKNKGAAERLRKSAIFAANAKANPVPFDPKPVGEGINTTDDEYLPTLTADAATMIFTRKSISPDGYEGDENFFSSTKSNGVWSLAEPMNSINSDQNEGAQSISPDASWLVFTACNRIDDGSHGSCDLYWSQFKKEGWTKPVPFSSAINSKDWESQPSIGADNKTLVFTRSRKSCPPENGKNPKGCPHRSIPEAGTIPRFYIPMAKRFISPPTVCLEWEVTISSWSGAIPTALGENL